MESDEPPPKVYGFKERDFKRDNALSAGGKSNPTAQELARMAGKVTRQTAAAPGVRADDPNDVYAVLERNRAMEKNSGRDQVELKKKGLSRRTRDFWLLIVGGNLAVLASVFFSGLNVMTVIFGLAGIIIVSLGLTWVMWFVMSDY